MLSFRPPPPVRPRPTNKKPDTAVKPPPSRGGKPPSGAAGTAGKKIESRFGNKGASKDDKGSGASKSAPAKGKEPKAEENKDEKIVEEEKEERRFDGSGYDKDLVDMLGNWMVMKTFTITY